MNSIVESLDNDDVDGYLRDEEQIQKHMVVRILWDQFGIIFNSSVYVSYTIINGCLSYIEVTFRETGDIHKYSVACDNVAATFRDTCEAMIKFSEIVQ